MNAVEIYEKAESRLNRNEITVGEFEAQIAVLKDVVPVKHGRWIKATTYPIRYICSECGHQKEFKRPYCEICGTKMDGDVNGKT